MSADDSEYLRPERAVFSTLWRDALAALPVLHVLHMEECVMDDARFLAALAPTLQRLTRLEQLDLGVKRMLTFDRGLMCGKGRELASFWSALRRLTALTRLDLHETCFGRSCLSKLTQVCVSVLALKGLPIHASGRISSFVASFVFLSFFLSFSLSLFLSFFLSLFLSSSLSFFLSLLSCSPCAAPATDGLADHSLPYPAR